MRDHSLIGEIYIIIALAIFTLTISIQLFSYHFLKKVVKSIILQAERSKKFSVRQHLSLVLKIKPFKISGCWQFHNINNEIIPHMRQCLKSEANRLLNTFRKLSFNI